VRVLVLRVSVCRGPALVNVRTVGVHGVTVAIIVAFLE
jgi:hypothetical protein